MKYLVALAFIGTMTAQSWTAVPGVPVSKIQDQIFDPKGCLWITTTDNSNNAVGVWKSNACGSNFGPSTTWTRMYNDTAGKMVLNSAGEVVVETHNVNNTSIVRFVGNTTPVLSAAKARWRAISIYSATGTIYAQAATCEIYSSTDGGSTFALMAAQPPYPHGNCFGALGVRQSDGHIFVGDEAEGGYEWTGSAWRYVGDTPNANCLGFAPNGDVWMCDSNNNPRKWDGKTTWVPIPLWPQHTLRVHSFILAGSDWYAAAKDYGNNAGPYVFKSSDGGATWSNDSAGLPVAVTGAQGNDFAIGPDGYLYFGTDDFASGGVYRKKISTPVAPPPLVSITGVGNSANYDASSIAPGEVVTIFGKGLGPQVTTMAALDPNGKIATELSLTRILFDGIPAPLVYVGALGAIQASAIVPYGVQGKQTVSITAEYAGTVSAPFVMRVTTAVPALYSLDQSGHGQGVIQNQDGTFNSAKNPAAPGDIIVVYGTGVGQTTPPGVDGQISDMQPPQAALPVSVTIGGIPLAQSDIVYQGEAPLVVTGLYQLNLKIPAGVPSGNQPIVLTVGGISSAPDLTVAVR